MVGGAWAAAGLNSKQKKEVKSIAKSFQGTGVAGPAGSAGPVGPKGDKGDTGGKGANGTNGTNTTTTSFIGAKGTCKEGGVEVKSATPATFVCNGSPWAAGGTLPKGQTETGRWGTTTTGGGIGFLPVSLNVPLAQPLEFEDVHWLVAGEGETSACPGTEEDPKAALGQLCVYTAEEESILRNMTILEEHSELMGTTGVSLPLIQFEGAFAYGAWAVTAP
jgi:hypothetical protein